MAGCTKERFGGHVKKQKGAGYGREKFEASRKMQKSQKAGGHCWMHKKSKKMRKPSKKGSGKKTKKSKKNGRK